MLSSPILGKNVAPSPFPKGCQGFIESYLSTFLNNIFNM